MYWALLNLVGNQYVHSHTIFRDADLDGLIIFLTLAGDTLGCSQGLHADRGFCDYLVYLEGDSWAGSFNHSST